MPILEVGDRDLFRKRTGAFPALGDSKGHNTIRIAIRKRLQEHGIHDAENSRIGANAERHESEPRARQSPESGEGCGRRTEDRVKRSSMKFTRRISRHSS